MNLITRACDATAFVGHAAQVSGWSVPMIPTTPLPMISVGREMLNNTMTGPDVRICLVSEFAVATVNGLHSQSKPLTQKKRYG